MASEQPEPLLVVVLGPTASGKTALSLALAERFGGEIVNCDSVAMYREFDIGTAKPTASERARAPHHLLDCVEPTSHITAGEYARQARQVLERSKTRDRLPIVVGGTGLYLRALLEGLFPGPQRSEELRERLRERAERRGSGLPSSHSAAPGSRGRGEDSRQRHAQAYSRHRSLPGFAAEDDELWQQHGRDGLRGFRILRLGLDPDRQALYDRINRRAQLMFEAGLVEETQRLLEKYGDDAAPAVFPRIQTGSAIPARRTHSRAGDSGRAASPSQLRQAADDLVSPRAGGSLVARLRGRCTDSARGRRSASLPPPRANIKHPTSNDPAFCYRFLHASHTCPLTACPCAHHTQHLPKTNINIQVRFIKRATATNGRRRLCTNSRSRKKSARYS